MRAVWMLLCAALSVPALAQAPAAELARLFPHEADVFLPSGDRQLARLELLPELLEQVKDDLSDLRLFDLLGEEVAYAVDPGPARGHARLLLESSTPQVLEARREHLTPEHRPALHEETYELALPDGADRRGWELVFLAPAPRFVRQVEVSLVREGGQVESIFAGSLFRLGKLGPERSRIALPPLAAGRLRVHLRGDEGGYLEPRLLLERREVLAEVTEAVVPLTLLAVEREGSRSVYELRRPAGWAPSSLRVQTRSPAFDRAVAIHDVGRGREPAELGHGRIFRVEGLERIEELTVLVGTPRGERLRVSVENGDSPPLEGLSFEAVIRQPSLLFVLPSSGPDRPAGVLRYGGGRAHLPQYDLAALVPMLGAVGEQHAAAGATVSSPSLLRTATLGPRRPNPLFDSAPALAFLMRPGAPVDRRLFEFARAVSLQPSSDGLSRLDLGAAALAVARPDLADVRLVDSESRQWPILIEAEAGEEWNPLSFELRARGRQSVLELSSAERELVVNGLSLSIEEGFFDRPYRLTATLADGKEVVVSEGRLVRGPHARGSRRLELELRQVRARKLVLAVTDGDEAPLQVAVVEGRTPQSALYAVAPEGEYELLLGYPDAQRPVYDVATWRRLILAVQPTQMDVAPLGTNEAFRARARLARGEGPIQLALWAVLVAAIAVLGLLVLRLVRKEAAFGETGGP
jgi:hypothetical protein